MRVRFETRSVFAESWKPEKPSMGSRGRRYWGRAGLRAASTLLLVLGAMILGTMSLAAQESPPESPPALYIEVPSTVTSCGESFELATRLHTEAPLHVVALRIEVHPEQLRIVDWSLGAGLERHVEDNGEPPACDVIVYPDGRSIFSIMALDVPYDSREYGTEWLKIRFEVVSEEALMTCAFVQFGTTEYEPGESPEVELDPATSRRRCAPVVIEEASVFRRGDVDQNESLDVSDAIRLLSYLFRDAAPPPCADSADLDDDGRVTIGDSLQLLQQLFSGESGGYSGCGEDERIDTLPRCSDSAC